MEPFVKNQYYPGKLLHAGDFIHEQEYGNRKLEFINRQLHGWGIVEGLHVEALSFGGLRLEAGSAIDGQGRILVVPQERILSQKDILELSGAGAGEMVLGISYAEETVEKERALLEDGEQYRPARKAETYVLQAYAREEWEKAVRSVRQGIEELFDTRVLYEDTDILLQLKLPRMIPKNCSFQLCIVAQTLENRPVSIGYRCRAHIQGGRWEHNGKHHCTMENQEVLSEGPFKREWVINAEPEQDFLVVDILELCLIAEGRHWKSDRQHSFSVQVSPDYEKEVYAVLSSIPQAKISWVPLAKVCAGQCREGEMPKPYRVEMDGIRQYAANPRIEGLVQLVKSKSGIGKIVRRAAEAPSVPEHTEIRVRRGVTSVPVPKGYRWGQILYSEEIAHGFGREEVAIWYGRVREEKNYAYWEKEKVKHMVIEGMEALFQKTAPSGWQIEYQALKKNIEEGTFQIALTLRKGRGRIRDKEIVISWTAVRTS